MAEGYVEDVLTRIVNVHWGGQTVVGTFRGRIYCKDTTATGAPTFKQVDNDLFLPPNGSVVGVSAGTINNNAVFVAIGNRGGDFFGPNSGCQIAASRDGVTWSVVFFDANVPTPDAPLSFHRTKPVGIVWDGKMFHASSQFEDNVLSGTDASGQNFYAVQDMGEQMYSSVDGFAWTKAEKLGGWQNLDSIFEIPSALRQYCVKPQNSDDMPDGLQGYRKEGDILARPTSLSKFYVREGVVYDPSPPAPTVTFKGTPDFVQDVGFACYAVAWSGGWVAAGKSIALAQPDQPFRTVFEFDDPFDNATCVVGSL
jgi:hypothetical protein